MTSSWAHGRPLRLILEGAGLRALYRPANRDWAAVAAPLARARERKLWASKKMARVAAHIDALAARDAETRRTGDARATVAALFVMYHTRKHMADGRDADNIFFEFNGTGMKATMKHHYGDIKSLRQAVDIATFHAFRRVDKSARAADKRAAARLAYHLIEKALRAHTRAGNLVDRTVDEVSEDSGDEGWIDVLSAMSATRN